ncbi:MAG: hypothetical protein IKO14_07640 [Oscillibacter sp.]|nr:hypothetical protein [Oscillibacter sp.]
MKKLTLLLLTLVLLTLPAWAHEADGAEPFEVRERHEAELRRLRELEANGQQAALMAGGSASVTVNVRLPSGAAADADTYMYMYLYSPAEIDASGRVIREPVWVDSEKAQFPKGASSATVVFQGIAAGNYVLNTYTAHMTGCKVLNCYDLYYNADGSFASSEYTATPFSVSDGQNVSRTVTLPAADAFISGVLRFNSPLSQDTEFEIYCSGQGRYRDNYYVYFTGQRGATSVPFSIGVTSGGYSLDFSVEDYYYLDYEGTLTKEYNKHYVCHVVSGADRDLGTIDGDILLGKTEKAETVKVDVSVTLPEALTQQREYAVSAVYQNDNYLSSRSSYKNVEAGQVSFSSTITLQKGREYAIGYHDTTDCNSIYNPETSKDMRYLSKDGGITTLYENAKKFTFAGDASVTIREPACGRVTGSVSRNGFNAGMPEAAYVYAKFPDGERYCARVPLGTADSAGYVIYVPMTHNGQKFELSAAMAETNSNRPLESSASAPVSVTFSGNVSAGSVSVSDGYFTVSGTVSLPDGVTAPTGGQAVQFEVQYEGDVYYIIPGGKNSVAFSFQSYRREDYSSESMHAYLCGRLSGVYQEISQSKYFDDSTSDAERKAWYQNQSLVFLKSAVISGTVSFASGVKDVGASMELAANLNDSDNSYSAYSYSYVSILKGQTSSPYYFTVPAGKLSSLQMYMRGSTDGRAADDDLYVDENWNVSKEWGKGPTVTGDRSGVNFTIDVFSNGVKPQIMSVKSYSNEENVMEGFRQDGYFYAVCAGPTGQSATLIASIYDNSGRFLGAAVQSYADLKRDGSEIYVRFDGDKSKLADAAKVRVFLFDRETLAPLADPVAF